MFGHSMTLPSGSRKATWFESDRPSLTSVWSAPRPIPYRTAAWSMAALKGWCARPISPPHLTQRECSAIGAPNSRAAAASPLCCFPGSRRQNRLRSRRWPSVADLLVPDLFPKVNAADANTAKWLRKAVLPPEIARKWPFRPYFCRRKQAVCPTAGA